MRIIRLSLFLLIFITAEGQILADEIFLKDGNIVKGKVIQITAKTVEYKPEGDQVFDAIQRPQVAKIIFENGKTVLFDENISPIPESRYKSSSSDSSAVEIENKYIHYGFFFRLQIGPGYCYSTIQDLDVIYDFTYADLTAEGGCGIFNFQIGWAVFDNLIIYYEFGAGIMQNADAPWTNSLNQKQKVMDVTVTHSGLGACYYIMPYNIYISPTVSLSKTKYNGNLIEGDSEGGYGFSLAIGKEWWASDNWGLGISLYGYYGKDTVKEEITKYKYDVQNKILGILFSATYN